MVRSSDKREKLITAAKRLIHRQGFYQTTLADIAREADVPLGNVYYYFKTKDELAAAVIQERSGQLLQRIERWERDPDPKRRLLAFIDIPSDMNKSIAAHGCPIGSLCQELDKCRTPLAKKADDLLRRQLAWVTEQFRLLGKDNADTLGVSLMANVQGALLLANALNDASIVAQQIAQIKAWIAEQ